MWAHYADNYSGICIEYDARTLLDGLPDHVRLVRLAYGDSPPTIAEADALNTTTAARKILSHKKLNWAYEREWRVLGRNGINEYGDERCVKAVYFGSRIDSVHRVEMIDALKDLHIAFFDMKVAGYEHKFSPLEAATRKKRAAQVRR
jgi:hypothetical protein